MTFGGHIDYLWSEGANYASGTEINYMPDKSQSYDYHYYQYRRPNRTSLFHKDRLFNMKSCCGLQIPFTARTLPFGYRKYAFQRAQFVIWLRVVITIVVNWQIGTVSDRRLQTLERFTVTLIANGKRQLHHVTNCKFSLKPGFCLHCFYLRISSSLVLVLSVTIVLDCFHLLIFYFEKFSTKVCRKRHTKSLYWRIQGWGLGTWAPPLIQTKPKPTGLRENNIFRAGPPLFSGHFPKVRTGRPDQLI